MDDVAGTLRTMRLVAMHSHRTYAVRTNATLRRVQIIWLRAAGAEQVVRTIWLPEGLVIRAAPSQLFITPSSVDTGTILIDAPRFERAFRVRANSDGAVELHEEPSA